MTEFNPLSDFITVRFECPECGEEVVSDAMSVPSPDFAADNNSDSMNYEDYQVSCDKCGRTFDVTIYNEMYGGEVAVEDVDQVVVKEENVEEEDNYGDYVFDLTPEGITNILDEIEILSAHTKGYLYRQLYAGTITSMEAFLSSTLLKTVLATEHNRRTFVEKYLPYQEKCISYSDIYVQMDKIDATIQETLRTLMYHNLGKIKPIYHDVLNIDLGDIGDIMKAVQIRHDIVHRSGRDKEGNFHEIQKNDVIALVEKVSQLISTVEADLALNTVSLSNSEDKNRTE